MWFRSDRCTGWLCEVASDRWPLPYHRGMNPLPDKTRAVSISPAAGTRVYVHGQRQGCRSSLTVPYHVPAVSGRDATTEMEIAKYHEPAYSSQIDYRPPASTGVQ